MVFTPSEIDSFSNCSDSGRLYFVGGKLVIVKFKSSNIKQ